MKVYCKGELVQVDQAQGTCCGCGKRIKMVPV